ncbi:MAG: dihydrodipicolinate synthase family protein [Rhodobacteraceae bacterium]|nr:dihydrodipicolinate synthase family protein [Paracoccaceae bacterium]MAY46980.1 dihydrodipicolinate synthase family protein [Paracoccaceae bacterium]QEW18714.1 L-2-keto-3-deoxyarabonate dehydratase [Marinibacterium anthonyi]
MSFKTINTARGVFVIAVTPFTQDGALDLDSTDRMVDFYRARGATGLTILGMMGEAPKMTQAEAQTFTARVLKAAGDMPVIVGVSAPGFAAMRELGHASMELGAAGVMIAPTPGLRTDDQVFGYYRNAADELGRDIPIVVQDYPLALGVTFSTPVLGRIIEEIPQVAMLKHEDWPGLAKITALRKAEAAGRRRIAILTGNGAMFLPEEMARGADGAMTGFAYPEMMVEVCDLMNAGKPDDARDLFDAYLPYARFEQQPGLGLAARKYVLAKRGAIASATARRPAPALSKEDIAEIELLLTRQSRALERIGAAVD